MGTPRLVGKNCRNPFQHVIYCRLRDFPDDPWAQARGRSVALRPPSPAMANLEQSTRRTNSADVGLPTRPAAAQETDRPLTPKGAPHRCKTRTKTERPRLLEVTDFVSGRLGRVRPAPGLCRSFRDFTAPTAEYSPMSGTTAGSGFSRSILRWKGFNSWCRLPATRRGTEIALR